ncbi:MAG: T9SS type A sorting domain-containing protein, partial [Bacteroidota bacterium]
RSVGDGADTLSNTVLIGVGNTPNQRTILVAGGGSTTSWSGKVANTQTDITSDWVKVGDYRFTVADPTAYSVGDNIVIYHPCTQEWLDAIDGGGTDNEPNWSVGSQPLVFNRRIVAIQGDEITVDVPLYNHLKKSLSPSYIYKYDRAGIKTQIGIEDLRIDIETAGGNDEAHAWNAVKMSQVEDAWVRNCTFLHFGLAGVATETATRITIENCRALDPVAQVTGARMYNFNLLKASSQVLVRDCHASNGRHHYVSNGTSWVSGCVFLRVGSEAAYNASEGHRRWTMGLLYDNHVESAVRNSNGILLALYNRGSYGTAHGWSAVHSVAWNCDMSNARLVVEKPPTAQNYAIACQGTILGSGPFAQRSGYIEGANMPGIEPTSLYEAQLFARVNGLSPSYLNTSLQEQAFPTFYLFPNPTEDMLQIGMEEAKQEPTQIRLFDTTGRLLLSEKFRMQTTLDLSSLNSGIYVLQLQQGELQTVKRIRKE